METGRRFGNQVGDPLRFRPTDVRPSTAQVGYSVRDMNPTGPWAGHILAYVDNRKAGAFSTNPFHLATRSGKRTWLDFFLAGKNNADEDLARYLRVLPGDRFELAFGRNGTGQHSFRVYHTAALTGTPDQRKREFFDADRDAGTTTTAATFLYLSDVLRTDKGHSWQIRPVDRAGNEKTGCAILTGRLTPWPNPPTGVEIHRYNRTTGLVTLKWSHASGFVATSVYRLFRNTGSDTPIRYGTSVKSAATAFLLTGTPAKVYATFTLPRTGPAAVGVWLAGVRHRKFGIEEDNFSAAVRFVLGVDGSYVGAGYPTPPSFISARATAGGKIVVRVKHDNLAELNQALRFLVYRSPGNVSTIMYGTAIGTITRGAGRFFEGTFQTLALTHGDLFRFGARAQATAGTLEVNTAYATATADADPPATCPTGQVLLKVVG